MRKFANLDVLISLLQGERLSDNSSTSLVSIIQPIVLDQLTFDQQLAAVQLADIFMGIHGAGLSHTLFLQPGSCLVEFRPPGWTANPHFMKMAEWRSNSAQDRRLPEQESTTSRQDGIAYFSLIDGISDLNGDGEYYTIQPTLFLQTVRQAVTYWDLKHSA
ncbi:unnamed protein product [Protopolystoma xenopodis]|uniref:EGF domain-specific O-linked N-acetylglucosamine transferase n=1 Tax=Protopolystoma xenopodis TaxID=117903 RepID=A0A448WBV2_9PLAT|nr:unnamed protein product [Protopolystoma xenopodis]